MLKDIMNMFLDRDKNVKIREHLYMKLIEEVGEDEDVIESLVNRIISERFNNLEKELIAKREAEIHEEGLFDYYIILDKYLFATLNNGVKIGITNGLIGKEDSTSIYTLKDYNMSYTYKYIHLILERNGDRYPITFKSIKDIRFSRCGDRLKTWIYMTDDTWRFYLDYDENLIRDNIESGKIDIDLNTNNVK